MSDLVRCEICGFKFERRSSFGLYRKTAPGAAVDPGVYWLCGYHGLLEHRKGWRSQYYFKPYVRNKARKYFKRFTLKLMEE